MFHGKHAWRASQSRHSLANPEGGGGMSVRRGPSPADSLPTTVHRDAALPEDGERYDEAEVRETFHREFTLARDYIDGDIGPARAEATEYYLGLPFGDEQAGRSSVMSRDVRDTIINYMPPSMRILFGGDRAVEFVPFDEADVPFADQATDFVNLVVLRQDNDGFAETYAAVKDGLTRKVGFLKWWWDARLSITGQQYTGLSEEALTTLGSDPEVSELQVSREEQDPGAQATFAVTCVRTRRTGRARFGAVPPEEILLNREARSIRDARAVFHRRPMLVNDLVAMGYLLEDVLEYATSGAGLRGNREALARQPGGSAGGNGTSSELMREVLYVEGYILLQAAGRDIATLHRVCSAGEQGAVLRRKDGSLAIDEFDHIPISSLCPDPEPHTFFGTCPADLTMDVQRIKSAVQRGMLDSLSLSINPRTEVVEGQVNLHDLMNPEVNRIIRVRAPGMMKESSTAFLGSDCLPVLGYYDQVIQQRTKQNDASQGLDASALQSTSKAGVAATINAAQAQQELTARVFAEGGFRDLFRGLLRLLCQHQDQPRMVRLRDTWVSIDPRQWNAEMDVSINVALGAGSREDRIMALREIKASQEQLFATLGNKNDLVTPVQYRNTLGKLAALGGFPDAGTFYNALPPDYQAPDQPPQPDPAERLVQVQMAELNLKAEIEAERIKLEREKAYLTDATLRFKATLAAQASVQQGEARAGMAFEQTQLQAAIAAAGSSADAATKAHLQTIQAEIDEEYQKRDHEAARAKTPAPVEGDDDE